MSTPTAPVDERDIGAVAVRVLTEQGHGGKEYVLTGPESLTQYEQIATIARVIGRALRIEEIVPEKARLELGRDMPPAVVNRLLDAWAAGAGEPAFVTCTVQEVAGTAARTFRAWVIANAAAFRA